MQTGGGGDRYEGCKWMQTDANHANYNYKLNYNLNLNNKHNYNYMAR